MPEYKINIQKSVLLVCTNNKLPEKKKKKETVQYKIASNTIKHFGINLAKEVKISTMKILSH